LLYFIDALERRRKIGIYDPQKVFDLCIHYFVSSGIEFIKCSGYKGPNEKEVNQKLFPLGKFPDLETAFANPEELAMWAREAYSISADPTKARGYLTINLGVIKKEISVKIP